MIVELLTYPTEQLPPIWKWQILSFLRMMWPDGFVGENQWRDWITKPEDHPVSLMLVEGDLLIAHVNVVWKELHHANQYFKTYGLTGVFTYPALRGQGYGLRLVQHATEYIDSQDADIALFNCDAALVPFYQRAGWQHQLEAQTLIGPANNPEVVIDETLMMRFISPHGQRYQTAFRSATVYFGSDSMW
jgi:GNAT superfamily N-acetyltransferase